MTTEPVAETRVHRAASTYAARGWPVFPIYPVRDGVCACGGKPKCKPGKHPCGTEHGLEDATTDGGRIHRWFQVAFKDANLAIRTGEASGLLAIDIDPDHGGAESLAALIAEHGLLPRTVINMTGGGGCQYIFRYPKDREIRNSASLLGDGIDVRGEGGYILVAPSNHVSGGTYKWHRDHHPGRTNLPHHRGRLEPAGPPTWLLEALTVAKAAKAAGAPPKVIPEGQRNDTAYGDACALARRGLKAEAIRAAIEADDRYQPPLDSEEIAQIVASAMKRKPDLAGGEIRPSSSRIAVANGQEPGGAGPASTDEPQSSWCPIDFLAVLEGDLAPIQPVLLGRSDGLLLLYPGRVHTFQGEPESLKSWLAQIAVAECLEAGGRVFYLDFESEPKELAARLLALSAERPALSQRFVYIRPDDPMSGPAQAALNAVLAGGPYDLAVIDGVTAGMELLGLDPSSNKDAASWAQRIVRPVQLATTGPTAVVDHVVKSKEARGGWAIGAQHKKAGVDGAVFSLSIVQPFGRGLTGLAKVKIEKDRPGALRPHTNGGREIAQLRLVSNENGPVTFELLLPAGGEAGEDRGWRPTGLMESISRYLESSPAPLSQNDIESTVRGKAAYKRQALAALVADSYVERFEGGNKSFLHRSLRAFREVPE